MHEEFRNSIGVSHREPSMRVDLERRTLLRLVMPAKARIQ